ncbi:MAG TPA: hypothetical protein VGP63_11295 [Planctomycetaceae bacterium]|jgi:regulator of protease activity HflC (stomatin/prohibitin superfamily)|nr:hypothetical protein [Planctomycetaceae bacterium]
MVTYLFYAFLGVVLIGVYCVLRVFLAKSLAIQRKQKEVDLFGGLVKLILWEANEGIVLLKNKQVSDVIYGPQHGGGTQFIFPVFGEELRIRVPLTLRLMQFQDANVLTRESTQLFVKVALWWWIADLEKYYYVIDKDVNVADDDPRDGEFTEEESGSAATGPRDAAERWILTLAESCIRKLVSQSTTAMVVSKNAMKYIHIDRAGTDGAALHTNGPASSGVHSHQLAVRHGAEAAAPENLADAIEHMLNPKVAEYGLKVNRVEIQEVRLPQELQAALDRLFRSHLLPAQSEQESRARQIELQSVANVLGVQAVALKEVMKEFKGSTYVGGFPKFLDALFAKTQADTHDRPALPGPTEEPTYALTGPDDEPIAPVDGSIVRKAVHKCPRCGESVSVAVDPHGPEKHFECPSCGASLTTGVHRGSHAD